jgi:hypothetical protein
MSNAGCASCRLRFTRAQAAYLGNCPLCAQPMGQFANHEQIIGFRLYTPEPFNEPLQTAVAISLPVPDPHGYRP